MSVGSVLQMIEMMDGPMRFLFFFLPGFLILLTVAHPFMKKKHEKLWSLLCAIPLVVFVLFLVIHYIKGNLVLSGARYTGFALAALIVALWGLDVSRKKSFVPYTILTYCVAVACMALTVLVLWGIVDELPDLQSRVIRKAFKDELTYAQMADLFHVSEDAIRSARACAMKRLQSYKTRNRLAPYVDGNLIAKSIKHSSYSSWKNTGMSAPEYAVIKIEEREEKALASYTVREVQRKVLDQYKLMLSQAEKTGDRELIKKIKSKIDDVWEIYHIR